MKKTVLLILTAFLTIAPLQARKVKGKVTAQGAPLEKVLVSDGYRFTVTQSDGSFTLNTHKDARYVFVITLRLRGRFLFGCSPVLPAREGDKNLQLQPASFLTERRLHALFRI